jgi:hypothetical protein
MDKQAGGLEVQLARAIKEAAVELLASEMTVPSNPGAEEDNSARAMLSLLAHCQMYVFRGLKIPGVARKLKVVEESLRSYLDDNYEEPDDAPLPDLRKWANTGDMKQDLIKLGTTNPELRPHIRVLLKQSDEG